MLHPSTQKIQDYLDTHFPWIKAIEHTTSARSAQEAADTIGCKIGQIVKSLIFMSESWQAVLCLVSGPNRLDEKKVQTLLGEKISRATPEFVKETTWFTIGGIPPFGHTKSIQHIFFDPELLDFDTVWAAAWHPNAVFEIEPQKLFEATHSVLLS